MSPREEAALRLQFHGQVYELGEGRDQGRTYLSVRAVEFEAAMLWPTDDEIGHALGLRVRFFEAGARKGEALLRCRFVTVALDGAGNG